MRTLTEARAAFQKADQIPGDTTALLADLKARYLLMQPEPSPDVHEYAARNRAIRHGFVKGEGATVAGRSGIHPSAKASCAVRGSVRLVLRAFELVTTISGRTGR